MDGIKRFDVGYGVHRVMEFESPDGFWVRYEDHVEAMRQLRSRNEHLENECEAFRALHDDCVRRRDLLLAVAEAIPDPMTREEADAINAARRGGAMP